MVILSIKSEMAGVIAAVNMQAAVESPTDSTAGILYQRDADYLTSITFRTSLPNPPRNWTKYAPEETCRPTLSRPSQVSVFPG